MSDQTRDGPAPQPICRAVMLEIERWRVALGLPMDKFSEYAGLPDRCYSKHLHGDAPSGRNPGWGAVQVMLDALMPGGFDLEIRPRNGVMNAQNLKAKLLHLRAQTDPKTRRELMRDLSKRGAQKGGVERWKNVNARSRARIMRKIAKKRWSKPRLVEITNRSESRPVEGTTSVLQSAPAPAPRRTPSAAPGVAKRRG